jgi:hypothetical protein
MTNKPIIDRAEVSLDIDHKLYMGSFGRDSVYDARADAHGLHLHIVHPGDERRQVGLHLQYFLLAGILEAAAESLDAAVDPVDALHQPALNAAAKAFEKATRRKRRRAKR